MKNGYYTFGDYLQSINSDMINGGYFEVVGENMSVKYGDNFQDLVYNKIKQITRRLSNCYLLNEESELIEVNVEIDDDTLSELNHVIQHNIEALAQAKHSLNVDWKAGINHTIQSANPLTNNERALNDNMNYNELDILSKQIKILGEFNYIFEKMRDEFKQFISYININ